MVEYKPPAGPPPSYGRQQFASNNPYNNYSGQQASGTPYQPPPGAPPSYRQEEYQPPPGPPPSKKSEGYQPPPGPPPSHKKDQYQPPPGPPTHGKDDEAPPPYDPWLAVPDNALLPPPPPMKENFSPANNATEAESRRAHAWCRQNPLWGPRTWTSEELERIDEHLFGLSAQPGASAITIQPSGPGRTLLISGKRQGDTTLLSTMPLITPQLQPRPGQQRTIYYQVHVKHLSGPDATFALGFVAPPFPPDRLPGWHRGSLAVHNDDGRRFVNDDDGGVDFVRPFFTGELVGIGMTFTGSKFGPASVKVFFTRNGREEGSWDLHESRDADEDDGGVIGLDGTTDLYAAIGVCGGVELEVNWAA